MEMETEMEMGLRFPSPAKLPPLAMTSLPFPAPSCAPSWSQIALMSMWRNRSTAPAPVSQSVCLSVCPLRQAQASLLLLSSRCCCRCRCVGSPVTTLLPPSVTPYPTQQTARRTATLAQHHHRSITYRRFLRKLHIPASGPHITWYFHSFTHSLHYRCISAELDLCTNSNPEILRVEYILHNRACA